MTVFRGLLAYPITPADPAGQVDPDALVSVLDRSLEACVDGIGLLGSTGGYMFLCRAERRRAVRAAVRHVGGRVPVTVGIGALRTDEAVALAQDAAEEGADGVLLAPVSYTPLTAGEVFAHVAAVAGATPLPLCLYDNPATTGFRFEDGLLRQLGALPTVAAIKRPAPDPATNLAGWVEHQRALLRADGAVGCSVDWHAAGAVLAGADAWHCVLAGLLPRPCVLSMRAARNNEAAEVRRLDGTLAPIWALFRSFGSVRVMYAMATRLGIRNVVPPRPILPLAGEALLKLDAALEQVGR